MSAPDATVVRTLLARLAPPVEEQYRRVHDPEYWRDLNRDLTIGAGNVNDWVPDEPATARTIAAAISQYRRNGYASLDNALARSHAERMRRCIDTLRAHDWPAVFAFVYDAFWQIGRAPLVSDLLRELLGDEPFLLSRVWAHYVAPASGNAGWKPHIDGRPGTARTISLWIPVSEATLANGCMYVVTRDETTEVLGDGFSGKDQTYAASQIKSLLRNTRACPARPGQLLCWDERIIHWGSAYEAGPPRVSLALEFSTRAFAPLPGELRPVAIDRHTLLPDLTFRLAAIGRALLNYRRFEPFLERFGPLAQRLVGTGSPAGTGA